MTAELWRKQVLKSRQDDFNPRPGASGTFVCSNHFPLGKRTPNNPETDFPSVFLNLSDYKTRVSPKKRRKIEKSTSEEPDEDIEMQEPEEHAGPDASDSSVDSDFEPPSLMVPLRFEQLTRECDVKFYTGIPSTEAFHCLFEHLSPKALHMQYWRGMQQTQWESRPVSPFEEYATSVVLKVAVVRQESLDWKRNFY